MDVTGLKDYTIFVVIVVLIHVGGSCRPTASCWHNTIIVHFDKLYKLYLTANFRWLRYIAIVITLGDW